MTLDSARYKLRRWLAHCNRRILGDRWLKYADEHLFAFAALEKPLVNPHWHLLIRVCGSDPERQGRQLEKFEKFAKPMWLKLVPSGTVDLQRNYDRGAAGYVAKDVWRETEYTSFITPDEFQNR